jgi:peptidoglycan/xylan/chitin deacetylase (PgdA/CDA1 family)
MWDVFRLTGGFLVMLIGAVASLAQQRYVTFTFDDLPAAGTSDAAEAKAINISILNSLDRHRAPAIGFVIERSVQQLTNGQELLGLWVKHGYDLGNHTFSHTISDNLTAEEFESGIIAGEASFAPVLARVGKTPRYFRFPQNHTGDNEEKHDAIAEFLIHRGYRVAPCTIDNEDVVYNTAYLRALSSKDNESATRVRAEYLAYTSKEIDYYTSLHKQIFGREIPHIMLLHVNRLNADVIEHLLELFEQKQYLFKTLDAALSDPAYDMPDRFLSRYSKSGPMWGYRWAGVLDVRVNGNLETEPSPWVMQYGKATQVTQ